MTDTTIGVRVTADLAKLIDDARGTQSRSEWMRDAAVSLAGKGYQPVKRLLTKNTAATVEVRRDPLPPAEIASGCGQLCMAPGCMERDAAWYGGIPLGFPGYEPPGGVPLCPAHYRAIIGMELEPKWFFCQHPWGKVIKNICRSCGKDVTA